MAAEKHPDILERLWDLFDQAAPEDPDAARSELLAAGLDPVLVRARLRAYAEALIGKAHAAKEQGAKPHGAAVVPLPLPWVKRGGDGVWRVEAAVASASREDRNWITLDFGPLFGGGVRVGLFLNPDTAGESSLVIEWDAEFYQPAGWRLSLYHAEDERPFFERNLGAGYRGSAVLTPDVLGVDPGAVPLRFGFSPDTGEPVADR